jgi:hypothetical protein
LSGNFKVSKIYYDEMGYMIYKFYLIATHSGSILKNKNIGINLIIKEPHQSICNELKKNGLIYDRSNSLEIRRGDGIVLYLSNKNLTENKMIK